MKHIRCTKYYLSLYYYHCVDASAGGLLVPDDIVRPVVSASTPTWFIRNISNQNKFTVPKSCNDL